MHLTSPHGSPPPPRSSPAASQCPACGNWNFSRRQECNKCGAQHPSRAYAPQSKADQARNLAAGLDPVKGYGTARGGEKRTGEAGGFREFDDEEEFRRKKRAFEAEREKEQRKAEKKKCEFCKRFSCIC